MTEKPEVSEYRPLADRGDSMKWYEFKCCFCSGTQEFSFPSESAMGMHFWNPVHCLKCNHWSTPVNRAIRAPEKRKNEGKKKRIQENRDQQPSLFEEK